MKSVVQLTVNKALRKFRDEVGDIIQSFTVSTELFNMVSESAYDLSVGDNND